MNATVNMLIDEFIAKNNNHKFKLKSIQFRAYMLYIGLHLTVKRREKYTENIIYVLDYTSCRLCSEFSDSDEYVMLFCLPSSGFIFMPTSLSLSETNLWW